MRIILASLILFVLYTGAALAQVYVANEGSNNVYVGPTISSCPILVAVGDDPNNLVLTPDGSHVYVANGLSSDLSVIQTSDNTVVATVDLFIVSSDMHSPVSPTNFVMSVGGDFVYVSNANLGSNNNGTVSVIDLSDNTVVATVDVGLEPNGLVVGLNNYFVYVVNTGSNSVSVIDTKTNMVVDSITVGEKPISVATITTIIGEPVDEIVVTN